MGPEFGDQCTGTLIGEEGIRAVWRARDDIIPPTLLTDVFVRRSGCADVDELFRRLYRRELSYDAIEPMAKLVFEAALEGDAQARVILGDGGRYLAAMVNAAVRRLRMQEETFEVITAGSVFKGESPDLIDAMRADVGAECPRAKCVAPAFEPSVGALLMAFERDHALTDAVYGGLERSICGTEEQYKISLRAS